MPDQNYNTGDGLTPVLGAYEKLEFLLNEANAELARHHRDFEKISELVHARAKDPRWIVRELRKIVG